MPGLLLFALSCLILTPPAALSGPWLRPLGETFISLSTETPMNPAHMRQAYGALYQEYGLHPRWTLVLDAGRNSLGYGKTIIYLRRSLWSGRHTRLAVEFGLGQEMTFRGTDIALRSGLSIGRGIRLGGRDGWLTADMSHVHTPYTARDVAKLETTFGLHVSKRMKTMLQTTAEMETGKQPFYTATPSIAVQISDALHITFGAVLSEHAPARAKLGLWMQY